MPTSSRRGVVFSIDALLAAILLSLFAASLVFLVSGSANDSMGKLLLKKQSSDLLSAMDRSGVLGSMDEARAKAALESALAFDTAYLLSVEHYNYSGQGGEFALAQNFSHSRGAAAKKGGVMSQRDFVVAREGSPPIYGLARLTLWTD